MGLGDVLKDIRERDGLSRQECADKLSISYSALSKYETDSRTPDLEVLLAFSKYFGVSIDSMVKQGEILTRCEGSHDDICRSMIPILGTIRAGIPILASDNFDGELDLGGELKADFALRVTGDSMSWAGIHPGDLALIRHTDVASNGDVVAAGLADGDWTATLKYYIKNNGSPLLRAANPEYADIEMGPHHRIIGVLVHVIKEAPDLSQFTRLLTNKQHADAEWADFIETAVSKGIKPSALKGFMEVMQMMVQGKK